MLRAAGIWTARIVGALVSLVIAVLAVAYVVSERRMHKRYEVPVHAVAFTNDSATIARGAKLVQLRGCTDCHGATLAGTVMIHDAMLGRIAAANLTRGKGGRGVELTVLCRTSAPEWPPGVSVARLGGPAFWQPLRVLVCGGGAFNGELMRRLAAALPEIPVGDTGNCGIPPEQVEAAMCAWLAHQHVEGAAGNVVAVTGYDDQDRVRQARAAGCDEVMVKPIDPQRLKTMLASYVPAV